MEKRFENIVRSNNNDAPASDISRNNENNGSCKSVKKSCTISLCREFRTCIFRKNLRNLGQSWSKSNIASNLAPPPPQRGQDCLAILQKYLCNSWHTVPFEQPSTCWIFSRTQMHHAPLAQYVASCNVVGTHAKHWEAQTSSKEPPFTHHLATSQCLCLSWAQVGRSFGSDRCHQVRCTGFLAAHLGRELHPRL